LVVEPLVPNVPKFGLAEDQRHDDPESIAAWVAAVEQIEPLIWEAGEREELERFMLAHREFNVAAVRKQMDDAPKGDGP
jgi:hypothetical protein